MTRPRRLRRLGAAAARRWVTVATFVAVALGSTGVFATITLSPLVAVELTAAAGLSGMPAAAVAAGSVLGAMVLGSLAARHGRGAALVTGYVTGAAGGALGMLAVGAGGFVPFLLAALLVGVANSAVLQARYAVADAYPAGRRTTVLAVVLWAGTIGAVAGPNAIDPAAGAAVRSGIAAHAGGLALVAAVFATGAVVGLVLCVVRVVAAHPRARPAAAAPPRRRAGGRRAWAVAWHSPVLAVAVTAMVVGQWILAAIQTVTPLHASAAGADLDAVGVVMSSHVLGMYVLVPVAGWLAERTGHQRVVVAGLLLLAGGAAAAAAVPAGRTTALAVTLFVLAVGWSFEFVAASGLLTRAASVAAGARTQGTVDTLVFAAAGLASASAGLLLAAAGFAALCLLAAALVALPLTVIARTRSTLPTLDARAR